MEVERNVNQKDKTIKEENLELLLAKMWLHQIISEMKEEN
ncbi:hypothetical protein SATMO3_11600 [Sporomusa aerivorans]